MIFTPKFELRERCNGVHCVDLGESFPKNIYLLNLASIQQRTSLVKFARSPRTDPPGPILAHVGSKVCLRRAPRRLSMRHTSESMTRLMMKYTRTKSMTRARRRAPRKTKLRGARGAKTKDIGDMEDTETLGIFTIRRKVTRTRTRFVREISNLILMR